MKCEDCKHWEYVREKSRKRYGKCVGMFPDREIMTYFDFECSQYEANKKRKFVDAYERLADSIRLSWGLD